MKPSQPPQGADHKIKIRSSGLEDQASAKDFLGFTPYVNAIFSFLENAQTKPPFTMSIEGDWGSGKSSFMLQLQNKLKTNKAIVINFNAWRHDKVESMWAAFALTFIRQLEHKRFFLLRPILNFIIVIRRFNWLKGWDSLLLKIALIGLYGLLAYSFYQRGGLHTATEFLFIKDKKVEDIDLLKAINSLGLIGLIMGGIFSARKITELFGNPLAIDLNKYVTKPNYAGHTSFIEDFHADFDKVVKVLAFNKKKIYVFIDDLDRSEIPKAAELMQGLNMMISNSPKVIFVIGMDREKVAAGIAAKYDGMLKYLTTQSGNSNDSLNIQQALKFGGTFLQKFIQLSFRISAPTSKDVRQFVDHINNPEKAVENSNKPEAQIHSIMLEDGEDAELFKQTVALIAPFFESNPRQLKQFVNGFRLKCHIAYNTGLFLDDEDGYLTIPQVGKFVAMIILWPEIIDGLILRPSLIKEVLTDPPAGESASKESEAWRLHGNFVDFLKVKTDDHTSYEYDMSDIDYKLLINTSPSIVISPGDIVSSDDSDSDEGINYKVGIAEPISVSTSGNTFDRGFRVRQVPK